MATLAIRLDTHGGKLTIPLPKEWILKEIPESLLASALSEDPGATTLDLTHPDVHPNVIRLLQKLAHEQKIVKHCPELHRTHRYLNIPRLLVYADPLYEKIPENTGDHSSFDAILAFATKMARCGNFHLYWHIFGIYGHCMALHQDLHEAVKGNSSDIVRWLLEQPEIDPTHSDYEALRCALDECKFDLAQLILAHPKVDPSFDDNVAIRTAIKFNQTTLCTFLLAHPRLSPINITYHDSLQHVINGGNVELLQILLTDERITPTFPRHLVETAMQADMPEMVVILLDELSALSWSNVVSTAVNNNWLNYVDMLLRKLPEGVDVSDFYCCLGQAADLRHTAIFRRVLEEKDMDMGSALDYCPTPEYRNIVLADSRMEPIRHDLRRAVRHLHLELTKLIISETKTLPEDIIIDTVKVPNIEVLCLLLADGRADPTFQNNEAIKHALLLMHRKSVEALLTDKRVVESLGPCEVGVFKDWLAGIPTFNI